MRDYPSEFLILLIMLCIDGFIAAGSVLAVAPLADYLIDPSLHSPSSITQYIINFGKYFSIESGFVFFAGFFLVSNLLKSILDVGIRFTILKIKYRVLRGLISNTLKVFLQARWTFFSGSEQGKLLNTFTRELGSVGDTLGHLTTNFAQLLQLIIYMVLPIWLNPQMALSAMALALILSVPFLLLHRLSYRLGRRNTETSNKAMGVLSESLGAAKLILGFARQSQTLKRYLRAFDSHISATLRTQTLTTAISSLFYPVGIAAGIIAMGIAHNQGSDLTEMATVLWSLMRAMPVMGSLLKTNVSISNFLPSYEQLVRLRNEAQNVKEINGDSIFRGFNSSIVFDKVSFSYPGRTNTLKKVELEIRKGEMTALVGESGSGKSTLTDLLLGFQIQDQGVLLLDGIPLSEWNLNSFREKIGYVPQDPQLFHCSIQDNLLWSSEDATKNKIWEACRLANADNFIRKLPEGLDTVVGDRGVRLSGGQRQRIALARALLRNPELLILDEATSFLDSESEELIKSSIETISKETTVLIIAHRLSTVAKANRIYVLNAGAVVESGSYTELVNNPDSLFARMVRMQQLAA